MTTPTDHGEVDAARLFFVEHELVQAHHTISFLRDCIYSLEHPEHRPRTSHGYPEQTEQRLRNIEALVEIPEGCPHPRPEPGCSGCEESTAKRAAAIEHAAVLGWTVEPGRWPRPEPHEAFMKEQGQ